MPQDTTTRRRFVKSTGAVAAAATLAGCQGGDEEEETTTTTETTESSGTGGGEQTLNLISSGVRTLDPIPAGTSNDIEVIVNILDGLTNYKNGSATTENLLATGYELSDDSRTYTFNLKEGVEFHDGSEFTAGDVVYSFERLAGSPNSGRAPYILSTLGVSHETETVTEEGEETTRFKPGSLAVEATDTHTVEITLDSPFHAALQMFAFGAFCIVPEGLIDDVEGYDGEISQDEFEINPIGTGPFTFDMWESGTELRVSKFGDYHGETAKVDKIHWQVVTRESPQYEYAMNRNVDIFELPTSKYEPEKVSVENTDDMGRSSGTYGPARNGDTLNYLKVPLIASDYIGFNTVHIPKPVRQAVAYAFNQHDTAATVYKNRNEPAYHFTPPSIYPGGADAYETHARESYPYGYDEVLLDEAVQVMEEAGYSDSNRASFTLAVYTGPQQSIASSIRDKMVSAYIDIEVQMMNFTSLANNLINGNIEGYMLGWSYDWPAPDNFLQLLYPPKTDTSSQGNVGFTNWSGTEAAQQAINAWEDQIQANMAPGEENQEARAEGYVAIEEANWEDVIQLPVIHESQEVMSYDWVDFPKFGGGGFQRQVKNSYELTGEKPQ